MDKTDESVAAGRLAPVDLARLLARGVCRALGEHGLATLAEFTLSSGRRVDVMGLDRRGQVTIVEIKTSLEDFRSDQKWPEYLEFCDQFFFAVPPDFPLGLLPEECGLIVADRYEGEVLRPGPKRPMAAAARGKQTLLFAHIAAHRFDRSMSGPLGT